MMGTWIVLGVLVIGVVMALLTVRQNAKGGGCPGAYAPDAPAAVNAILDRWQSPLHGKYLLL